MIENTRTDEGRTTGNGAGTVVGETRELVAIDLPEVGFDNGLATSIVGIGASREAYPEYRSRICWRRSGHY